MNLDELEAKARAAKDALAAWLASNPTADPTGAKAAVNVYFEAMHALHADCDPDTILDLIERVRAGEALRQAVIWSGIGPDELVEEHARSLAHSPQEAST